MLKLFTSTNALAVYGFCRRFVDSPRLMIDDLIALVINYYDCDAFNEACTTKYLRITNKNNLSMVQVKKMADQDTLQFVFGTKTIVVNCNNNIYYNNYNYSSSKSNPVRKLTTDQTMLSQKWNLTFGGRHKKNYSKSHVCCGIGIINVNDMKRLHNAMKRNEKKDVYGLGTGKQCYHSDIACLYDHAYLDVNAVVKLGPDRANRFRWLESKFIGFCCIPVNLRHHQHPSFHSMIACNQMRHVKYQDVDQKNQCLLKKGDKIELSIKCEKGQPYLCLKRKKCVNGCGSSWKCIKQSIGCLQNGKYQLVVWLKDKKTTIGLA